ncbi:hypothetical protein PAHAL_1G130100 [Panicum hallii]|jgi:hypothetical protein|uniref:Late embryogenesis abundant protein LEA-2 subgroup domain-containing protein n=1 Tax=Panicum hallii TaxID=206008 RepID=A0A2S3GNJ6_9POAL|nr:hypothetical protein PAHAL_1G130100 [Panicum hallii]
MATETISPPFDRRWRVRHFILAAVGVVLVAIAIVLTISISLAPAHISFSISNATLSFSSHAYNLTITANNTSRRPDVMYDFMSAEIWTNPTTSYLAEVNRTEAPAGRRQGPRSAASFNVLVDYRQFDLTTDNSTNSGSDADCKVVVVARVRFRIGHGVPTRPYTVTATCMHVNFLSRHNASDFPVECAMY